MDSLWYSNNNLVVINKEDRLMQARQKRDKVTVLILAKDYPGATELLRSMNRDYPNFGDYQFLMTFPWFDRIRKEYPPFAQALTELRLPMKLDLEKHVKL